MSFLSRILGRKPPAAEQRLGDGMAMAFGGEYGPGRGPVSVPQAEALGSVLACVELISSAIASLPATVEVDTPDGGRAPAPRTATAWNLLTRPNEYQSWPSFAAWLTASVLLQGNGVAAIGADARGAVTSLVPAPWPWLLPLLVEDGSGSRRLVFDIPFRAPIVEALGLPRRLLPGDVLHVRARSDFGLVGRSVLSRAAGPVREGLEISTVALRNWQNGLRPSAIIKSPTYLSDTQRTRYEEGLKPTLIGAINAGNPALLEGGWDYQAIALNSVDSEFLATRQFSVADVCRLFAVPEVLLQMGTRSISDLAPYVTAFAQLCLSPLVTMIEREFDHAVLPSGQHLKLDMDGLQRGSFASVTAAICALVQSGVLSPNDGREAAGWPRSDAPGADDLRPSGAPSWPADGPGSSHLGPSPGPTGNAPPEPGNNQNQGSS